jgi:hypothetical protein
MRERIKQLQAIAEALGEELVGAPVPPLIADAQDVDEILDNAQDDEGQ